MGNTTRISWAMKTWNPFVGCRHVSPACDRCYAEAMLNRLRGPGAFDTITRTKTWNDPFRWQRDAEKADRYDLVFTCSLSDFFIQQADGWRPEIWSIIKRTPNLVYQILTKRPQLIGARLPHDWGVGYKNVWLGVSVESKQYLKRMDVLRDIPAHARFVSAEPLLEDICPDLEKHIEGIHQIIVGGESGNGSDNFRPMDHDWARRILKICRRHGIAFWYKQSAARRTEMGTQLDGQTIQEYPAAYYEYGKRKVGLFA
jgi:protein gp37